MTSAQTITSNLPFGLFSAASLSGPMPVLLTPKSTIIHLDDAGPSQPIDEIEALDANEKPFWED